MAIVAALLAALLFALASVLQHRSARQESHEHGMRVGLLARLAVRPVWLVGILADAAALALQFLALAQGSLALVQPLLVSGLLFALPLSAAINRHRLRGADWAGALATVAGLALFLVSADVSPGVTQTSLLTWGVVLAATLVPAGVLVGLAGPGPSVRRAVLLAAATGLAYGLCAALIKATAGLLSQGVVAVLVAWQPYALVAIGAGSLLVGQSAFQAAPLRASLPILTVLDPVVSIVIGTLAFDEDLSGGAVRLALEVLGLVVLTVGVVVLARSPLVSGETQDEGGRGSTADHGLAGGEGAGGPGGP
ncbi:MAG TPA: DMT family transporter [Acidimicrobiales bacterium]|nr:DMT family transporter [Acidimicrobiales bacterium]